MIKVSVIIPVYNAKKYLDACLKSVLEQGFGGLEVILVNDKSTDGSEKKCLEYGKKFDNVRVLQGEGRGAAAARNLGLKQAKGKYIWFIDADDEVVNRSIKKLFRTAEREKADIVVMGAKRILRGGKTGFLKAVDVRQKDWKKVFIRYGFGPWQMMMRREFLLENELFFPEGIIHEDMALMSALVLYTDKVVTINEELYLYFQREESVLRPKKWNKNALDIFTALEFLYKKFEAEKKVKKYWAELEYFFIWNLLLDTAKNFAKFPEGRAEYPKIREMMKKYFPKWRKNKYLKEKGLGMRLRCELGYWGKCQRRK